jgi:hypothetical protein
MADLIEIFEVGAFWSSFEWGNFSFLNGKLLINSGKF